MRSALVPILLLTACAGPPGQSRPADPGYFSGQATAGLDEAIRIANLRIIPLEIVEDSRCPADVQCVWAGRLVARVQIQSPDFATRTEAMELDRGIALKRRIIEDLRPSSLSNLGLVAALEIVGDVRGRRLMMCVEYVRDKKTRERLPDSVNISKRISNACEAEGLLVRPIGHLDVLSPPLTITREQVDFVVDTLKRAIVKAVGELKAEGVI